MTMTELNPNPVIKGFDATTLKLLAIVAMVIDHTAWAFVPTNSIWGQVMHAIGRLTFPIMAFFIAEGFFYTRNFKKYLFRMLGFAILSHFAFQYFNFGRIPLLRPFRENRFFIIFTPVFFIHSASAWLVFG